MLQFMPFIFYMVGFGFGFFAMFLESDDAPKNQITASFLLMVLCCVIATIFVFIISSTAFDISFIVC